MERWEGRVALVTGAATGIGVAIATKLMKIGMIVVGFSRRIERLEALSRELSGVKGKLHGIRGEIAKEEDIDALFAWIHENLKSPVHVLINNATIVKIDTMSDGNTEDWREVLEVNVLGLSVCIREALKSMKNHGFDEGHIFNINSVAGHRVISQSAPMFTASKFAVTAITESLRKELAAKKSFVRVTSISPGLVNTELVDSTQTEDDTFREALLPSDIADAIGFVLSLRQPVHIPELTIVPRVPSV